MFNGPDNNTGAFFNRNALGLPFVHFTVCLSVAHQGMN